jgi:hypothetical protein
MSSRLVLNMAAGAALLLAPAPVQASSLAEADQPVRCDTCAAQQRIEPMKVRASNDTWHVAALSKAPRRYTRSDIEGLRLLTRMR